MQSIFYFHTLFFNRLLKVEINNELHLYNDRIDTIIEIRDHIYIFEFKMELPVKTAKAQIKDKGYPTTYLNDAKPIIFFVIKFLRRERNIVGWLGD